MFDVKWNKGDRLIIAAFIAPSDKGLTYGPAQTVTAMESGQSGGWDVFDAMDDAGNEMSFYGFSAVCVTVPAAGGVQPIIADKLRAHDESEWRKWGLNCRMLRFTDDEIRDVLSEWGTIVDKAPQSCIDAFWEGVVNG